MIQKLKNAICNKYNSYIEQPSKFAFKLSLQVYIQQTN